ncbi:MAG: aminotransferase class V-fold PLP-dependent enzyme, partial [Firmicutes bacterium]|nr:aminotransferase class V-fold PLP-dependent enzyme [Bacillota bacterium]
MQNTTSQRYIYLDNAATVRPFDSVNLAYNDAEQYSWYNSSALYTPSIEILDKIEKTREFVANNLGVLSSEIFFVSGATEANNWIAQRAVKNKNGNIVYSCVEHPSVINAIKSTTCSCVQVDITKDGDLDWEDFLSKLNSQTSLVSIAHVCGNTGTVNDIHKVVQMVKKTSPKAVVHSDGVQAWCKWDYSLRDLGVDAYT